MIILDSSVVSELMRPEPEKKVIAWLDRQPRSSIWTNAISVFEVHFGLQAMPLGKRRDAYTIGFENLLERMDHRIAPFGVEAAQHASALMASRKALGRPREARDTMIAGIVIAQHAKLATRNTRDFDDLAPVLIDPWTATA
jgi:predicted nucleic acid-binding protein